MNKRHSNFNRILFSFFLFYFMSKNQSKHPKKIPIKGHLRYTRSSTFGPYQSSIYPQHSFAAMGSPYYHRDMEDPISPALPGHHRSRSASRPPVSHTMDYPSNVSALIGVAGQFCLTKFIRRNALSIVGPWWTC